jgi:hypothetical protein
MSAFHLCQTDRDQCWVTYLPRRKWEARLRGVFDCCKIDFLVAAAPVVWPSMLNFKFKRATFGPPVPYPYLTRIWVYGYMGIWVYGYGYHFIVLRQPNDAICNDATILFLFYSNHQLASIVIKNINHQFSINKKKKKKKNK